MDTNDTIVAEIKRGPGRPKKTVAETVAADNPNAVIVEAPTPERLVPVRLLYDTWIGTDRHKSGLVVNMPLDQAKTMLAAGKCERADPLPGE